MNGSTRARDERGQVIVLVAISIVALIGLVGLAIDVGYAYYSQRSLQASADAAALAGASALPNPGAAAAVANSYSGSDGAKNSRSNVPGVTTSVTTKCVSLAPRCAPANAIVVSQTANVPTIFARVLGIDSFTVHARATACWPCSTKPLDIMLVLDRTGSMCQDPNGNPDPACTDINNARAGMETFLGFLDPKLDRVGFDVFPPAKTAGQACDAPSAATYDLKSAAYVVVPLSQDYSVNGWVDPTSPLVATIDCQQAGGRTSYATAIEKAQAELDAHGRPGARDVIIMLSDGAANIGPSYYPAGSPYRTQPCHQGVTSAAASDARGTVIYTIGYDLGAEGGGANICENSNGKAESPAITAHAALQAMASEPDNYYNKPDPGQLNTIYSKIAIDISAPNARLIPEDAQ
jgi:Putative Flp pilus-assembly TadE/G-like/von Willebrand factor type A domain